MPGAAAGTHGLACEGKEHTSIVTTGESRITGIPCAMVLTVSFVLSPGTGLYCPRHRRDAKHRRQLGASVGAPEPHGFAVRKCIVRLMMPLRPSHSASRRS
jgi:hypothetical protein